MSLPVRSAKNIFRKPGRALGVIIIIGVSLGIFLCMTIINESISDSAIEISSGVETRITVTPAGEDRGAFSGATMNESVLDKIAIFEDNLEGIQPIVNHREGTGGGGAGGGFGSMLLLQGQDPSYPLIVSTGGTMTFEAGRTLEQGDANETVAVVGTFYAENNGLTVGDKVETENVDFEIVGVFTTGNRRGDMSVIAPIHVVQDNFNISGFNMVYVEVDYVGNMDYVEENLKIQLGEEYDVIPVADMQTTSLQDSINAIMANSEVGAVFALITAVVVMVFIMVIITRERIREIGVLKAIGFTNHKIMAQFFLESSVLATLGFLLALAFALVAGPSIQSFMVDSSSEEASGPSRGGPGGGNFGGSGNVDMADFSLSALFILYTLMLALILGALGAVYPISKALKLKPAEALRYE